MNIVFSNNTSIGESYQDFEVSFKMLNLADYNSISNLFSVYLKTNEHLKFKL